METPNYVLKANEAVSVPKHKPKEPSTFKKIAWRILLGITICFVAYDLLIYQELAGFTPEFVAAVFLWWTFPKQRNGKRIAIWAIVSIIILLSFIVNENFFTEVLPPELTLILVPLYFWSVFTVDHIRVPSPFEIWFYDDYLIVYREKRYYNKKVSRKEYNKFFYNDISKVEYRTLSNRIQIYGTVEAIWYDYNKDGTLPEQPTYHRKVHDTFVYFYTTESSEVDFVSEIEEHTPIMISFIAK